MGTRSNQPGVTISGGDDNRQFIRQPLRSPARITIYPPEACSGDTARHCHVLTQDVSQGGISIIYAKPLLVGQQIEVELTDGRRSAVVCRVRRMEDGHYLIGCRFEETAK